MGLRRKVTRIKGVAMKVHPSFFKQSEKIREIMSKRGIKIGQIKSTGILAKILERKKIK